MRYIPPLKTRFWGEREGTAIAIAGYPRTQIDLAKRELGFTPSVHAGTVNALLANRSLIEFDAYAEDGNSGGPLLDGATRLVYGVVTEKFHGCLRR